MCTISTIYARLNLNIEITKQTSKQVSQPCGRQLLTFTVLHIINQEMLLLIIDVANHYVSIFLKKLRSSLAQTENYNSS